METRSYTLNLLTIIIQLVYTGQVLLCWCSVDMGSCLHTAKPDKEFQTGVMTATVCLLITQDILSPTKDAQGELL